MKRYRFLWCHNIHVLHMKKQIQANLESAAVLWISVSLRDSFISASSQADELQLDLISQYLCIEGYLFNGIYCYFPTMTVKYVSFIQAFTFHMSLKAVCIAV